MISLYDDSFRVYFNAQTIAERNRRYACAAIFHVFEIFDSMVLIEMCLKNEQKDL